MPYRISRGFGRNRLIEQWDDDKKEWVVVARYARTAAHMAEKELERLERKEKLRGTNSKKRDGCVV